MRLLPHMNTRVPLAETDFNFLMEVLSWEIQTRSKEMCAFGIISPVSPLDSTSPLYVAVDSQDSTRVLVSVGGAMTLAGNLVYSKSVAVLTLSDLDTEYTIFIEYDILGIERALSRYSKYEPKFFDRIENAQEMVNTSQVDVTLVQCGSSQSDALTVIRLDKTSNLANTKVYPTDRLDNMVKLATASRSSSGSMVNLVGTDLRPWFSPKDVFHRLKIGTGVITDQNPHGTGISDLTVGPLTLFDIVKQGGCIVSKDVDFATYPGSLAEIDNISSSGETQFATNAANSKTTPSNTRPWIVADVIDKGTGAKCAFYYNRETGKLSIRNAGSIYKVKTFTPDSCTPYLDGNRVSVIHPNDNEAIITNGVAINSLDEDTIAFDTNLIARTFRVYITEDKILISNPAILGTFAVGAMAENDEETVTASDLGISTIEIGINSTGGAAVFSVEVTGILEDGTETTEVIDVGTALGTSSKIASGTTEFVSISSWKIVKTGTAAISIPTDARLIFYALRTYNSRRRLAAVCDVVHDGTSVTAMYDKRKIVSSIDTQMPAQSDEIGSDYVYKVSELASQLRYADIDMTEFDDAQNCREYRSVMIDMGGSTANVVEVTIREAFHGSVSSALVTAFSDPVTEIGDANAPIDLGDMKKLTLSISAQAVYGVKVQITGGFTSFTVALRSV